MHDRIGGLSVLLIGHLALGLSAGRVEAASVIYVDADAPGLVQDGTSWCTAYLDLDSALATVSSADTVRVADGVYIPDDPGLPDPRDATFTLSTDVVVDGGYAGCGAANPDARDPSIFVTELSGGPAPVRRLVTLVASVEADLRGVRIEGADAEGDVGAGILASGAHLRMSECVLSENRAWRGGAIYTEGGTLDLERCRFEANVATGEGGAIFDASSSLVARESLFWANQSGTDGGAVFLDLCWAEFYGCSFAKNHTDGRGGAIYDYVGVQTVAGNCIFWGNTDAFGSGESAQIFLNPSNSLDIEHSTMQGWSGTHGGVGNIGADPLWSGIEIGDLHLLPGSPCIDQGSNDLVESEVDLEGNPRIRNGTVDMGCLESLATSSAPLPDGIAEGHILGLVVEDVGRIRVRFTPPSGERWTLEVYSVSGRHVVTLDDGESGGPASLAHGGLRDKVWDTLDRTGRQVPSGRYLVVLEASRRVLDVAKAFVIR